MSKVWDAIKRAGAWIRRIFEDSEGLPSSKRIAGVALIGFALVYAFNEEADPIVLGSLLGAGLAALGISSWSK